MASATPTPIVHTAYASSEPDEVREFIKDAYGARSIIGTENPEPWVVSLTQTQAGPVTVSELDMPLDLGFEATGQGDFVFGSLISGTSQRERGRDLQRFGGGDVILAVDREEDSRFQAHRAHTRAVTLAGWLLDDLVGRDGTDRPIRWRFTGRRAVAGGPRRWNQTAAMLNDILTDPQTSSTALVLGPATRLLAATALAIFPNTLSDEPLTAGRHDDHPDTLRRAIAFIDAHPDHDITLPDVARSAHVTPRAVQLAFRRHLDTTPMAYLRQVRLHHAHLDLQAATGADGQTVTRIAMDWGFANASRFAAHYRVAYGRAPSHTLRS